MDNHRVPQTATLPRHPDLLITPAVTGDGYVILLARGHRLVDAQTGLVILRDCLAAIRRHTDADADAARTDGTLLSDPEEA